MKKNRREFTIDPRKGIMLEVDRKAKFEVNGIIDK